MFFTHSTRQQQIFAWVELPHENLSYRNVVRLVRFLRHTQTHTLRMKQKQQKYRLSDEQIKKLKAAVWWLGAKTTAYRIGVGENTVIKALNGEALHRHTVAALARAVDDPFIFSL